MLWSRWSSTISPMECRALQRPPSRAACRCGASPPTSGEVLVTTGFDLLMAQCGVGRGLEGAYPSSYDDADAPYTPAWQERFTGIGRETAIRFAREFARNAELTNGKSMVIVGASANHWYYNNLIYRSAIHRADPVRLLWSATAAGSTTTSARKSLPRLRPGARSPSPSTGSSRRGSCSRRPGITPIAVSGATRRSSPSTA